MAADTSTAEAFLRYSCANGRFDEAVMSGCELREVAHEAHGRVVLAVPVTKQRCNRYGTLHGGCIAALVDIVSTAALLAGSKSKASGVTLDLNVSYATAAKLHSVVLVEAETLKVGRSTALLSVTLRDEKTGALVATGRHTKFLLGLGSTEVDLVARL
jgi:acyl-coenzyme A thioesterase 13